MTRFLLASSATVLLAACATPPPPEPVIDSGDFVAAITLEEPKPERVEIVETVIALPLPGQLKPVEPEASKKAPQIPAATIKESRAGAVIEPSSEGFVNAVQIYPYTEGALYRLYASPGQVTDIALQPGETLVSVSAGDTVRWVVGDTASGSGSAARAHILVKPVATGLRTNLMIATDRRTYHLELESTAATYMAALSWRYPQDELAGLTARNTSAAAEEAVSVERGLSLETLNFDYRVTGDTPDWKPVRVFDDGRQVFIQMPASISASEMPPLFVLSSAGEAELVNYRVRGSYYIVDRLFGAAELRHGTKPQTVVRISKASATRKSRWFGG
ncbi:MAG: P-type conjugative transfer protein TrbG [Hyphomonas sp.]|nr:P-type conjugative transfer protein TrbG [Hyphomonas sp.]MCB9971795.1 P-type conjugative transfer protein TrbG [Hyphomonas sp.]